MDTAPVCAASQRRRSSSRQGAVAHSLCTTCLGKQTYWLLYFFATAWVARRNACFLSLVCLRAAAYAPAKFAFTKRAYFEAGPFRLCLICFLFARFLAASASNAVFFAALRPCGVCWCAAAAACASYRPLRVQSLHVNLALALGLLRDEEVPGGHGARRCDLRLPRGLLLRSL